MEFLRQFLNGIAQAWRRLSLSARVNLSVAAAATVAAIVFMVITASRPQYVRLYDGVDPAEMPQIVAVLERENVPYQLQDNDQTILVPLRDRSRMKMAVSGKNLPSSQGRAPGFELFQQQDLMTNRWLQDVKYMRAVQGELQRQLNEFDFVNRSFVFIREGKDALYTSEQEPSEAAVTLDTKRTLSKSEINAVLHTISSFGGARLSTDHITLVTTSGVPLHLPPVSEFASTASSNLEYLAELEKQREERATRDLAKLGVRALVRVSAIVDFQSQTETVSKSEDGAVLSSYTTSTTTTSKDALPQGAPGAVANLPEGAVGPGNAETSERTEESIDNFQPSTTETKTVQPPGRVRKYIVSAIIEGETRTTTDAQGNEVAEYVGLTPERKSLYEQYILAAVGSGEEKTEITVNDLPFEIAALGVAPGAVSELERVSLTSATVQYAWRALQLAAIVIGFLIVRRYLRRAMVMPAFREEGAPLEMPAPSPEDVRREEISAEVARMSQDNPDAVAALLRTWLTQDEE